MVYIELYSYIGMSFPPSLLTTSKTNRKSKAEMQPAGV